MIGNPSGEAVENVLGIGSLLSKAKTRDECSEVSDGSAVTAEMHAGALLNVTQKRQ